MTTRPRMASARRAEAPEHLGERVAEVAIIAAHDRVALGRRLLRERGGEVARRRARGASAAREREHVGERSRTRTAGAAAGARGASRTDFIGAAARGDGTWAKTGVTLEQNPCPAIWRRASARCRRPTAACRCAGATSTTTRRSTDALAAVAVGRRARARRALRPRALRQRYIIGRATLRAHPRRARSASRPAMSRSRAAGAAVRVRQRLRPGLQCVAHRRRCCCVGRGVTRRRRRRARRARDPTAGSPAAA